MSGSGLFHQHAKLSVPMQVRHSRMTQPAETHSFTWRTEWDQQLFLWLFQSQRQLGELSDASISILMESVQHLLLAFTRAMESYTSRLRMRITGFESGPASFQLPDPVIGVDAGYGTCGSLTKGEIVRGNTRFSPPGVRPPLSCQKLAEIAHSD